MPAPAPTAPSAISPPARGQRQRPAGVLGLHLHDARVVQPAVVALGDHGNHDVLDPDRRLSRHSRRDRPVEDPAHGHRRGEVDGRLDLAELHHLQRASQLAGAVQDRHARRHRLPPERLGRARGDRGHAGPRDAAPGGRVRLVANDGDVTHADAGDVRDRVRRAGLEPADADAVLARAAGHARDPIPRERQPVTEGACAGSTTMVARARRVRIPDPRTTAVTVTRRASAHSERPHPQAEAA